tara:strand:- start:1470 stop:1664 length:195 start_codon:yes stop_codon:yes gene_type:complete
MAYFFRYFNRNFKINNNKNYKNYKLNSYLTTYLTTIIVGGFVLLKNNNKCIDKYREDIIRNGYN